MICHQTKKPNQTIIACIRVSKSFSFLVNSLMSMYIRWFIFSYNLWSFYPPVHFPSTLLSDTIAITNNDSDSASLWKTPLRIFGSVKLFPSALFSMFFFRKTLWLRRISCKFWWSPLSSFVELYHLLLLLLLLLSFK